MIKKISLIGLFICALLISGCAKEEPGTSSASSGTSSDSSVAPGMDKIDEGSVPPVDEISIEISPAVNENASENVSENGVGDVSTGKKVVKIQTSMGDILVELNEEKAPITVQNFLNYVESGFYNGTIFHRVIKDFMIQGGGFIANMSQKRTNAPIKIESSNGLKNDRGTIAMARTNVPDSATSQFFINHKTNDFLNYAGPGNPGYAVFGKVIEGMDVVDKIAVVTTTTRNGMADVPVDIVTINSVSVVSQ